MFPDSPDFIDRLHEVYQLDPAVESEGSILGPIYDALGRDIFLERAGIRAIYVSQVNTTSSQKQYYCIGKGGNKTTRHLLQRSNRRERFEVSFSDRNTPMFLRNRRPIYEVLVEFREDAEFIQADVIDKATTREMLFALSQAVAHKIHQSRKMSSNLMIHRARAYLDSIISLGNSQLLLPGTVTARTLRFVARGTGCAGAAIFSVKENEGYLEYYFVRKGAVKPGPKEVTDRRAWFPEIPIRLTMPRNIALDGVTLCTRSANEEMFSSFERCLSEVFHFTGNEVIFSVPISFKQDLNIGVCCCVFSPSDFVSPQSVESILLVVARALGMQFRWIWQRRFKQMIVEPIFKSRETRVTQKSVFLVMPFGQSWSTRTDQAVRDIFEQEKWLVSRADDMFGHDVMEDIWKGIVQSELVLADTTGRNPNVFYEIGIAHSIGKEILLITQSVSDIPFDIQRYRHIEYSDNYDGFVRLREGIRGRLRELAKPRP
jgi:hypothetical protein